MRRCVQVFTCTGRDRQTPRPGLRGSFQSVAFTLFGRRTMHIKIIAPPDTAERRDAIYCRIICLHVKVHGSYKLIAWRIIDGIVKHGFRKKDEKDQTTPFLTLPYLRGGQVTWLFTPAQRWGRISSAQCATRCNHKVTVIGCEAEQITSHLALVTCSMVVLLLCTCPCSTFVTVCPEVRSRS